MVRRQDISKGKLLRLLSDWITVPKGTMGTVECVGTHFDGTWWVIVRWHDYKPLRRGIGAKQSRRRASTNSLNLWEADLGRFEIVTDASTVAQSPSRPRKTPFEAVTLRLQLDLPFQEKDALAISSAFDL